MQNSSFSIENGRASGGYRQDPRTDVSHSACIVSSSGSPKINCTIMNISKSGALLKIECEKLPLLFDLVVEEQNFRQKAVRVWGKGAMVGIRFSQELVKVPDFLLATQETSEKGNATPEVPLSLAPSETYTTKKQVQAGSRSATRSFSTGFGKRR